MCTSSKQALVGIRTRHGSDLRKSAAAVKGDVKEMAHSYRCPALLVLIGIIVLISAPAQVSFAANLLSNPGFEAGCPATYGSGGAAGSGYGWNWKFPGAWSYAWVEPDLPCPLIYNGTMSLSMHTSANGWIQLWQDAAVAPEAEYTASVWVHGVDCSGTGAGFGAAATDAAGLWVLELDAAGNVVKDHGKQLITTPSAEYIQKAMTFTTNGSTTQVRYVIETVIACPYALGHVSFDDCVLDGPPAPEPEPGRICQLAPVQGGQQYTARARFRAVTTDPEATYWGNPEVDQWAALYVLEYDAAGNAIGSERRALAAETMDWESLTVNTFTTDTNTGFVEIGGVALMREKYNVAASRAVFDTFALEGPRSTSPAMTVSQMKMLADGSAAQALGKVVTAAFSGYFYIEEADRSSGIKVLGTAKAGDVVEILGSVQTQDGEKTLIPKVFGARSGGSVPEPLGVINRSVSAQFGAPVVGLYTKTWGRVDATGGNPFTLTDGSGASLKVYAPSGYSALPGDYVNVVGCLGAEMSGSDVVTVVRAVSVAKTD